MDTLTIDKVKIKKKSIKVKIKFEKKSYQFKIKVIKGNREEILSLIHQQIQSLNNL